MRAWRKRLNGSGGLCEKMIIARSFMRRRRIQENKRSVMAGYIYCKKGKREYRISVDICKQCKDSVECKSYLGYLEKIGNDNADSD